MPFPLIALPGRPVSTDGKVSRSGAFASFSSGEELVQFLKIEYGSDCDTNTTRLRVPILLRGEKSGEFTWLSLKVRDDNSRCGVELMRNDKDGYCARAEIDTISNANVIPVRAVKYGRSANVFDITSLFYKIDNPSECLSLEEDSSPKPLVEGAAGETMLSLFTIVAKGLGIDRLTLQDASVGRDGQNKPLNVSLHALGRCTQGAGYYERRGFVRSGEYKTFQKTVTLPMGVNPFAPDTQFDDQFEEIANQMLIMGFAVNVSLTSEATPDVPFVRHLHSSAEIALKTDSVFLGTISQQSDILGRSIDMKALNFYSLYMFPCVRARAAVAVLKALSSLLNPLALNLKSYPERWEDVLPMLPYFYYGPDTARLVTDEVLGHAFSIIMEQIRILCTTTPAGVSIAQFTSHIYALRKGLRSGTSLLKYLGERVTIEDAARADIQTNSNEEFTNKYDKMLEFVLESVQYGVGMAFGLSYVTFHLSQYSSRSHEMSNNYIDSAFQPTAFKLVKEFTLKSEAAATLVKCAKAANDADDWTRLYHLQAVEGLLKSDTNAANEKIGAFAAYTDVKQRTVPTDYARKTFGDDVLATIAATETPFSFAHHAVEMDAHLW